jgi:diadenosine tetraphosphate (Ap4A) HIT family hydrolase
MDNSTPCPFCALPQARAVAQRLRDRLPRCIPVTPGSHAGDPCAARGFVLETTPEERTSMLGLLDAAKLQLHAEFGPAGYNIGINDGAAAGQTVGHLHVHLIPRYPGDRPDPRGGVRWVNPRRPTTGPTTLDMKSAIEVLDAFENIRRAQRAGIYAPQATAHPVGTGASPARRTKGCRVLGDRRPAQAVAWPSLARAAPPSRGTTHSGIWPPTETERSGS